MKINTMDIDCSAYVDCEDVFYTAKCGIDNKKYHFGIGINKLEGDIDSDVWAISYLLSMSEYKTKNILFYEEPKILVNDEKMSLKELSKYTCYISRTSPFFSKRKTVRQMVIKGLKKSGLSFSPEQIRDMFYLEDFRFNRPLKGVGNEIFRAMSAIAFSYGKQVFCFPWLSKGKCEYYGRNITWLLTILESLHVIAIVPMDK